MILAVDIGNTNIVLGVIGASGEILYEARMATDTVKTSDQYTAELKSILSLFELSGREFEGCIVSSVVPPVLNSFRTAIRKLMGSEPMIVGPGVKTGLNIRIDDPAEAGADLIAAAVAARNEYPLPIVMIDMGTATTLFVLDERGCFIGGMICPGLRISQEALTARTSLLPGIKLDAPKRVIGKNTVDCMRSGIMTGNAAMLDGLVDRIEEELGTPVHTVATGGISRFILPLCRREICYDKDLLLKGLYLIYEKNKK